VVKRNTKKLKNRLIKPLIMTMLLFGAFVLLNNTFFSVSADSSNPLRSSRLNLLVQNPYSESISTEFPDGKSYIEVNVSAYKKDSSPLKNEPLVIDKPNAVNVIGPNTTEDGNVQLKFSSVKAQTAHIRVRLKNSANVRSEFKIRFASDNSIRDMSDKNTFVQGAPLTLQLQIKPWMTDHFKVVNARYIYTRRVNKWGFWFNAKRVATEQMQCNDGICQATLGTDYTSQERNASGSFTYQFMIIDQNGKTTYSKAFKAKLKNP
jgi:hypothetical protein